MADVSTGMDKGAMKALLAKSKKEPVNCGIAAGDGPSAGYALLKIDKMKAPKSVLKDLEKQFPSAKTPIFGTAVVDTEEDPKLVKFYVNKAVSGMAKRLTKTLRGTGYSKVQLLLEDGTPVDSDIGDDVAAVATAAGAPPPAAPTATAADPAALTASLTDLVRQLAAAGPTQAAALKDVALQAQSALKSGHPQAAAAAIAQLRVGLTAAPAAAATTAGDPARAATFAKARAAWLATRKKIEADVDHLHAAFMGAFKGHGQADQLSAAFRTRVETVMTQLDEALAEKLDEVGKAADPATHGRLVQEAQSIVQRYEGFIAGDPTIAALDSNPFTPLAIRKTLTATLATLGKAIA